MTSVRPRNKKPRLSILPKRGSKEDPVRVELTIADLQSAALATWRRVHYKLLKLKLPNLPSTLQPLGTLRNLGNLCRLVKVDEQSFFGLLIDYYAQFDNELPSSTVSYLRQLCYRQVHRLN
jgi:hypothetical protein